MDESQATRQSNQIVIQRQQYHIQPKVLFSSPANFTRINESNYYRERPMMLSAWTQTTSDDFEHFNIEAGAGRRVVKTENELLEKIRVLEENLRMHSEILSQIHATSAQKSPPTMHLYKNQQHGVAPCLLPQPSTMELSSLSSNTCASNRVITSTATLSPGNTVGALINPLVTPHHVPSSDSVKYTIIAEGNNDDINGEQPIQIELTTTRNDNTDHVGDVAALNCSSDSNRLEICLSEENIAMKVEEGQRTSSPTPSFNQHASIIKRRKLSAASSGGSEEETSYYKNTTSEILTPMNGNADDTNMAAKRSQKTPLGARNRNSLLKPTKHESNNKDVNSINPYAIPIATSQHNHTSEYTTPNQTTPNQKLDLDNVMVSLGPNNTRIPVKVYENMSWTTASIATRKLLMAIFDRKTLATHSMTGKPSPAFRDHDKPLKKMLSPLAIQDIIFAVTRKCNVSDKEVRNAITTKCADENKMMKLQMNKNRTKREAVTAGAAVENKENFGAANYKREF